MEIAWNESKITCEVHFKENQRIKCLNKGSARKETVFHATTRRIFHRLSSLATFDDSNRNKRVD